jgi:tRNA threonylcarbamoyladenosine biosynthesis protein TsaE
MEVLSKTTEDTKKLAGSIAKKLKSGDVLALYGELGAGKTTFTRLLVQSLGFDSRVQSPTFVIARRYSKSLGAIKVINHADLYRLKSLTEAEEIGVNEMFSEKSAITLVEWPEIIESILPAKTICLKFEYVDEDTRRINVQNLH